MGEKRRFAVPGSPHCGTPAHPPGCVPVSGRRARHSGPRVCDQRPAGRITDLREGERDGPLVEHAAAKFAGGLRASAHD